MSVVAFAPALVECERRRRPINISIDPSTSALTGGLFLGRAAESGTANLSLVAVIAVVVIVLDAGPLHPKKTPKYDTRSLDGSAASTLISAFVTFRNVQFVKDEEQTDDSYRWVSLTFCLLSNFDVPRFWRACAR